MIEIGSKVKVKEELTERECGIAEKYLVNLRGVETTVIWGKTSLILAIDENWGFEEDWLEEVK